MRSILVLTLCCAGLACAGDVYIVPFSHLDLFWAGTREECLSRGNRIISKALQIAAKHPEFRFLIEDEVFVANFVESRRGSAELEQLIRSEMAGILQNLPRGEAQVRNLVRVPLTHSFCSLEAGNVVISAVKKAELDVLVQAQTPAQFLGHKRGFQSANLLEESAGGNERETLRLSPYEIGTLWIKVR